MSPRVLASILCFAGWKSYSVDRFERFQVVAAQIGRRLVRRSQKMLKDEVVPDIEELVGTATEVERVLAELGETPYEPLWDEQEEEASESNMENSVAVLNNALINFLKGSVPNHISSFSHTLFDECQIYKGEDHIATACPRLNEPRPECARCGMPHRTENCGVKCPLYSGIGHSGDRCWGKHNEGRSHFGAANSLEVLLNDEEATATVEDLEVKCLTEDGPGIWEEEKSPKLGLFLNTLASSEGPLSLKDDVFDIFDVGEELVACHMVSEGNLDMSEDDRVVIRMIPEISTEPAAMGVSSYSNNVMRGEHQADHGYLGLGNFGKIEVVQRPGGSILHKQELDRDEPADEERYEGNAFNAGDDGTEKETGRNDLDSGEHTAEEDGGF
ncbi:unnamed protein product [Sphagnum balticum]